MYSGSVPLTADLYGCCPRQAAHTRVYNLRALAAHLPTAVAETRPFAENAAPGKKLLLFATMHYWIEHAMMIGLALAAWATR